MSEALPARPPETVPGQRPRPHLLCLPADSVDALETLGVASFIWRHYAPRAYFSKIIFALLGDHASERGLDPSTSILVFRRRWGAGRFSRAFFYAIRVPLFTAYLVQLIRREQIDVVRARSAGYNALAGLLAAKLTGTRCAVSLHAPYAVDREYWPRGFRRWEEACIERIVLTLADRVYCVGNALRNYAISAGVPPERAQVLFNRVDIAKFANVHPNDASRIWSEFRVAETDRILITVGRFVPSKDPLTLLEGFRDLYADDPGYKLVMVGDGPLRGQVDAYVEKHGLTQSVKCVGNVCNDLLPAYLHAADVFVFPTHFEGFGIVLAEAQAAGIPIVTTRIPGTSDIVSDDNAWLVPVGDPQALAAAVRTVFVDAAAAARKTDSGRRNVGRFDERVILSREEALYDELLASPTGKRA